MRINPALLVSTVFLFVSALTPAHFIAFGNPAPWMFAVLSVLSAGCAGFAGWTFAAARE